MVDRLYSLALDQRERKLVSDMWLAGIPQFEAEKRLMKKPIREYKSTDVEKSYAIADRYSALDFALSVSVVFAGALENKDG